jgi:hypothetical protein
MKNRPGKMNGNSLPMAAALLRIRNLLLRPMRWTGAGGARPLCADCIPPPGLTSVRRPGGLGALFSPGPRTVGKEPATVRLPDR